MRIFNTETSWGWPARLLHWAVAAIILYQLGVGVWMANFVDDLYERFALTQTHKSWGFAVFALALARIGWRAMNRTPAEPPAASALEATAARAAHVALYALMIALPVSGWLMASASTLQDDYGVKNMVFGWFELPDPFVPGSKGLEETFKTVHLAAAVALGGLLAVHAGAALFHHFARRDDVLKRMSWGR